MHPPEFWWNTGSHPLSAALSPAAWIYRRIVQYRLDSIRPVTAEVPIICVGNLVVGGAGKTPVAMDIGQKLVDRGRKVHFLSRGYRGRLKGPVRVDPEHHDYRDVGDEPMMLSRLAPTWISRDRVAGCRAAVSDGAELIVMDDGFQNLSVFKDLSLVVVDTGRGFGNGLLLPAGPLREPIASGLARAGVLVLLGGGGRKIIEEVQSIAGSDYPVLRAHIKPEENSRSLANEAVVAFAGIGDPRKFFTSLESLGCRIVDRTAFDDHHVFQPDELARLRETAERENAIMVTTSKDAERLPVDFRAQVSVLKVGVKWEDKSSLNNVLDKIL